MNLKETIGKIIVTHFEECRNINLFLYENYPIAASFLDVVAVSKNYLLKFPKNRKVQDIIAMEFFNSYKD